MTAAALYARVVGDMIGRFRSQRGQPGNRRRMTLIAFVYSRGMAGWLSDSDASVMAARTRRTGVVLKPGRKPAGVVMTRIALERAFERRCSVTGRLTIRSRNLRTVHVTSRTDARGGGMVPAGRQP